MLNSAAWAQCDSIYTFFAVSALAALLIGDKPLLSMLLYGASLAFKLQAMFLLPFLLLVYFVKKNFSLLYFAAVPAMMLLLAAPAILSGRPWTDVFTIYVKQTGSFRMLFHNYPSFWTLFGSKEWFDETIATFSEQFRPMTIAVCFAVVGLTFCLLSRTKAWQTPRGMLYAAFWSVYACVLLLPSMHERYGYLYEILALILAVLYPRTGKLCVAMMAVTLYMYGLFLIPENTVEPISFFWLGAANTAIFLAYTADFARRAGLLPPRGEEKLTF